MYSREKMQPFSLSRDQDDTDPLVDSIDSSLVDVNTKLFIRHINKFKRFNKEDGTIQTPKEQDLSYPLGRVSSKHKERSMGPDNFYFDDPALSAFHCELIVKKNKHYGSPNCEDLCLAIKDSSYHGTVLYRSMHDQPFVLKKGEEVPLCHGDMVGLILTSNSSKDSSFFEDTKLQFLVLSDHKDSLSLVLLNRKKCIDIFSDVNKEGGKSKLALQSHLFIYLMKSKSFLNFLNNDEYADALDSLHLQPDVLEYIQSKRFSSLTALERFSMLYHYYTGKNLDHSIRDSYKFPIQAFGLDDFESFFAVERLKRLKSDSTSVFGLVPVLKHKFLRISFGEQFSDELDVPFVNISVEPVEYSNDSEDFENVYEEEEEEEEEEEDLEYLGDSDLTCTGSIEGDDISPIILIEEEKAHEVDSDSQTIVPATSETNEKFSSAKAKSNSDNEAILVDYSKFDRVKEEVIVAPHKFDFKDSDKDAESDSHPNSESDADSASDSDSDSESDSDEDEIKQHRTQKNHKLFDDDKELESDDSNIETDSDDSDDLQLESDIEDMDPDNSESLSNKEAVSKSFTGDSCNILKTAQKVFESLGTVSVFEEEEKEEEQFSSSSEFDSNSSDSIESDQDSESESDSESEPLAAEEIPKTSDLDGDSDSDSDLKLAFSASSDSDLESELDPDSEEAKLRAIIMDPLNADMFEPDFYGDFANHPDFNKEESYSDSDAPIFVVNIPATTDHNISSSEKVSKKRNIDEADVEDKSDLEDATAFVNKRQKIDDKHVFNSLKSLLKKSSTFILGSIFGSAGTLYALSQIGSYQQDE